MSTAPDRAVGPVALTAFGIAAVLAAIAVYNLVTGVYGGAVVSSLGVIVATLFGVLTT
jgi:hypothetical protein